MFKVIFCTVKNSTNSDWLDSKLLRITHSCQLWWADRQYPAYIVDTYSDLNRYIDQADWLVVQTAGDVIVESNHLWHKLHNIPDDVGLIGHLVSYEGDAVPHLHPQCFIVRTKAIKELKFDPCVLNGFTFTKSKEDLHQGHAPLEIFLDKPAENINYGFGTQLLEQVLSNGYRVTNFDLDWRYGAKTVPHAETITKVLEQFNMPSVPSRGFCFPENNTEQFEQALQNLESNSKLDPSQQIIIEIFKHSKELQNTEVVNILNWDECPNVKSADQVVCIAGGFLAETIALRTGATKLILYDINPWTVDFKQSLYTHWDGKDYLAYAEQWATERNLITEPYIGRAYQKAEEDPFMKEIISRWDYFKTLDVEFICLDLIEDIDIFVNLIGNNSVVHTSTILGYYLVSAISHTADEIEFARIAINAMINQTNSYWSET